MDPIEFRRQQVAPTAGVDRAPLAPPARWPSWPVRLGARHRYSLTDQGYGLKANNVTLALNWNAVPSTGLLMLYHGYKNVHRFQVPEEYSS